MVGHLTAPSPWGVTPPAPRADARVVRHGPLVARQMRGQGAQDEREPLALAAQARQAQRERGAYGVVQLVGGRDEFRRQQLDALLRPARCSAASWRAGSSRAGPGSRRARAPAPPGTAARPGPSGPSSPRRRPARTGRPGCRRAARRPARRSPRGSRPPAASGVVVEGGPGGRHALVPVSIDGGHGPTLAQACPRTTSALRAHRQPCAPALSDNGGPPMWRASL